VAIGTQQTKIGVLVIAPIPILVVYLKRDRLPHPNPPSTCLALMPANPKKLSARKGSLPIMIRVRVPITLKTLTNILALPTAKSRSSFGLA
jgi:hypothetical protein